MYKIHLNGFKLAYNDDICVFNRVHNKQLTQTGQNLFYEDSRKISNEVVPMIIRNTKFRRKLLYLFVRRQAIWHCKEAFDFGMLKASEQHIFSLRQKIKLHIVMFYGKIRPTIRKVYYRISKGVVTQ